MVYFHRFGNVSGNSRSRWRDCFKLAVPENRVTFTQRVKITIIAENASRDAKYIQSMTVNEKANSKLWLTVEQLQADAAVKYVMGNSPNLNWGATTDDAPPSFEPDSVH